MTDVPLAKSPLPLADLAGADTATDGQVPTSDGAGGVAWETPAGGGGTIDHKHVTPASGSTAINTSGAWANLSTYVAGFTDITLTGVSTGDVVEISLAAFRGNTSFHMWFDVASIVSAAIVNHVSSGAATPATSGVRAWAGLGGDYNNIGGVWHYTVQAGDLDGGSLTLRMRVKTTGSETLYYDGGQWSVKNIGPQQS